MGRSGVATRQQQSSRWTYNLVRLHLDDVLAIEETLRDLADDPGQADSVKVSNSEWKADSVDELVGKGDLGPHDEFEIVGDHIARVSVRVRGSVPAELYVGDTTDLRVRGAADRIDSILRRTRLPLIVRLIGNQLTAGASLAVFICGLLYIVTGVAWELSNKDALYDPNSLTVRNVAVVVGALLLGLISLRLVVLRNGLVYLTLRKDRPGFLKRNREELLLNAINTVSSLAVGGVAGWLLHSLIDT